MPNPLKTKTETLESRPFYSRGLLVSGIILIVASSVGVFGILHHPTHDAHDFGEFASATETGQWVNQLVHGTMIVVVISFVYSLSWLGTALGFFRSFVRAGFISYCLGSAAMIVAATTSGMIVPNYTEQAANVETSTIPSVVEVLRVLYEINQAAALIGLIAMTVGILSLSIGMVGRNVSWTTSGTIGLVFSGICLIGIFAGHIQTDVHGMIVFFGGHAIWNVATGLSLIRNRHDAEQHSGFFRSV